MSHFIKDPLQTANNPLLPLGRLLPAKSPTYDIVYNRLAHFVVAPAFLAHPRLPHFRSMVASQTALYCCRSSSFCDSMLSATDRPSLDVCRRQPYPCSTVSAN